MWRFSPPRYNVKPPFSLFKMADVPYMPIDKFSNRDLQELKERLKALKSEDNADLINTYIARSRYDNDNPDAYSHYVDLILEGMGMEKHLELFKTHDVGVNLLIQVTDDDLKELGIADESDRVCILNGMKEFRPKQTSHRDEQFNKDESNSLDDIVMVRNVVNHLTLLNGHALEIHSKMSQSSLSDCFFTEEWTGVKTINLVIQRAITQCEKLSNILFSGGCHGDNMITSALMVNNRTLPEYLKKKMVKAQTVKKRWRWKKKLILGVLVTLCIPLMARFYMKHQLR